ncbi:Conjugal transfer protein [compost metagenome]
MFDDGRQVILEFDAAIDQATLPPLFLPRPDGSAALVNYRVLGRRLIVDRLFDAAELRLVSGRRTQTVRIEKRSAGR